MPRFSFSTTLAVAGLAIVASGSVAHAAGGGGWHNGSWYADGDVPPPPSAPDRTMSSVPAPVRSDDGPRYDPAYRAGPPMVMPGRDAWLADCRSRVETRDNGAGGAVIGGVVGGVAGNRIAGRHNRTVGTLGGAAVGAVAGAAIDRAEDRGRAQDECEAYLDDYYARYSAGYFDQSSPRGYRQGYAQPAYAPAYGYVAGNGCCGAPVMMVPVQAQPECTETVEYIYEDVPVRQHSYRPARRTKVIHDKRVKIVNDKRVSAQ